MTTTSEATHYQQYELLRRPDGSLWELGRGAMGITYKAYDANLHCTVALKVINTAHLDGDAAQQRFLREARAAEALRHPNVASVFNLGTDQDYWFYVMEFVEGETVEAHVRRHGPLPAAEALRLALQVARALAAAATKQLVHRDLKPANLMRVDQDGEAVVKVIDFGLAKAVAGQSDASGRLTMGGGFGGTPYYASPEQATRKPRNPRPANPGRNAPRKGRASVCPDLTSPRTGSPDRPVPPTLASQNRPGRGSKGFPKLTSKRVTGSKKPRRPAAPPPCTTWGPCTSTATASPRTAPGRAAGTDGRPEATTRSAPHGSITWQRGSPKRATFYHGSGFHQLGVNRRQRRRRPPDRNRLAQG